MSAQQPREAEDLTSSVPLLLPPLLFSILSGALIEASPWFGCFIGLVLMSVGSAIRRLLSARKVTVKVIEVTLIGAFIPILAVLSVASSFTFLLATNTINITLISIATVHLFLLWRMRRKLNLLWVGITSAVLLAAALIATFLTYERGFWATIPIVTVILYTLIVVCAAAGLRREQFSTPALRGISFALAIIGFVASIGCDFVAFFLFYELVAATVVFAIVFLCFDYSFHEGRWPKDSPLPGCFVHLKFWGVISVGCWMIVGEIARWADPRPRGSWTDATLFVVNPIVLFCAHASIHAAIAVIRHSERTLPVPKPRDSRAAAGIAGIVAVIATVIAIAAYYCRTAQPAFIHERYLLAIVVILYLVLTYLLELDSVRAVLSGFYWTLLGTASVIVLYIFVYGCARTKNAKIAGVEPIVKAAVVAAIFCANLVVHFCIALIDKDNKRETSAAPQQRVQAAAPVVVVQPAAIQRDVDSDYDSDDGAGNVVQAAV